MNQINFTIIGLFTGKLVKELVAELPLSLFAKLSDGKLSNTEAVDLAREVTGIVVRVAMEINEKQKTEPIETTESTVIEVVK